MVSTTAIRMIHCFMCHLLVVHTSYFILAGGDPPEKPPQDRNRHSGYRYRPAESGSVTLEQFHTALDASSVPRSAIEHDGATFYEYHFAEGDFAFPCEETSVAPRRTSAEYRA